MSNFIYIFNKIMLPIFILILIGYVAQKKLKMDSRTFARINIYVFIPATIFTKIYTSSVTLQFFSTILIYLTIISVLMLLIGEGVSRLFRYPQGTKKAFCNSLLFFNSGNYGLPMVELLYKGDPAATTVQVFIMLIQNILTSTFGVFQASTGNSGYRKALKDILRMPTLYVVAVVIAVKATGIVVPEQLMVPVQYLSNGFIGMALLTLGVQLGEMKFQWKIKDFLTSGSIRLLLSPLLGYAIVRLLNIEGLLAQSLILGVATPTAVNTAIIAKEFDNEPQYASQIVFTSTIFSCATIPLVIYFVTKFV